MDPLFVGLTLDRQEARNIITNWQHNEWKIETTLIGLDAILTSLADVPAT